MRFLYAAIAVLTTVWIAQAASYKQVTDAFTKAPVKVVAWPPDAAPQACVDYYDGAQGEQGPAGPANTLTIGGVTQLDHTMPAFATISGHAPNQQLFLGIPQGEPGTAADVDQASVLSALAEPGGGAIDRQPLDPQTNSTSMYQVRDTSGNVTWFQAAAGSKWLTSAGVVVTEIRSDGELRRYDSAGALTMRDYSAGITSRYDSAGYRRERIARDGYRTMYNAAGKVRFEQRTSGAVVL